MGDIFTTGDSKFGTYGSKRSGETIRSIGLGKIMLQNINGGGGNAHEEYLEKIIEDHKKKTAHLTSQKFKFNPLIQARMKEIKLTKGEVGLIIKENVTQLKARNKDKLQDAVDFGDYDSFASTFVQMTVDFYSGLKTHSEILKNKKMKRKERALRRALQK